VVRRRSPLSGLETVALVSAGLLEHAPAATRGASRGRRRAGRLAVSRRRYRLEGPGRAGGAAATSGRRPRRGAGHLESPGRGPWSGGDRRSLPAPPEESAGGVDEPEGSPCPGGDIASKVRSAPGVRQLHPVGDPGAALVTSNLQDADRVRRRSPLSGLETVALVSWNTLPPPPGEPAGGVDEPDGSPWSGGDRRSAGRRPWRWSPGTRSRRHPGSQRGASTSRRARRGPAEIAAQRVGNRGAGLLEHAPAATRGASGGRRRAGRLAVVRRRSPLSGSETVTGARRRCGSCIRVGRPRRWSPRISGVRTVVRRRSPLTPAATRGVGRGRRRAGRLAVSRRGSPLWSPRRLGAQTMARSEIAAVVAWKGPGRSPWRRERPVNRRTSPLSEFRSELLAGLFLNRRT